MLGSHPLIATGQESQLFLRYLGPFYTTFCKELDYPETEKVRKHGISSYITHDELIDRFEDFAEFVYGKALADKEGSRHILDKLTNNRYDNELLLKCFPNARLIHLVRDGRDVTASMLAAHAGWGKGWAPSNAESCAREWQRAVSTCRQNAEQGASVVEIRYEDLLSDGAAELKRVFDFLEIDVDTSWLEETNERFSFKKLKSGDYKRNVLKNPGQSKASGTEGRAEPEGFFRKGKSGGWSDTLSQRDLEEIYWVAGSLLFELGYTADDMTPAEKPVSIRLREIGKRGMSGLRRVLGRS